MIQLAHKQWQSRSFLHQRESTLFGLKASFTFHSNWSTFHWWMRRKWRRDCFSLYGLFISNIATQFVILCIFSLSFFSFHHFLSCGIFQWTKNDLFFSKRTFEKHFEGKKQQKRKKKREKGNPGLGLLLFFHHLCFLFIFCFSNW